MTNHDTSISARRVLTSSGVLTDHEVVIGDGEIEAIRPAARPPEFAVLAPGFVDIQVNGHDDVDVATLTANELPRMNELLLAQGVTSWCPTLVTSRRDRYAERLSSLGELAAENVDGPAIVGVHLEGPYLGDRHGAHHGVPRPT